MHTPTPGSTISTYAERLRTFDGLWSEHMAAARQLAAIGHVSDRPPLEALEEGSRCISCGIFVQKERSIRALGDVALNSGSYNGEFNHFNFHRPECVRLQVRIPLEPQAMLAGLYSNKFETLRTTWERRSSLRSASAPMTKASQSSSIFSLPTEIRLEIYAMILPSFEDETEIVSLHADSPRVITKQGSEKTGPRDVTKPNILRTCRTINEEAMDLIYAHTAFRFRSTKIMYLYLRSIGKAGRRLINAVDVFCGGREDAIAFAILDSCDNMKAMTIRLPRLVLLSSKEPPIWMLDGVSCLLALSGLSEVTFSDCGLGVNSMSDEDSDSAIIQKELTRPKGIPGDESIIQAYLDT